MTLLNQAGTLDLTTNSRSDKKTLKRLELSL